MTEIIMPKAGMDMQEGKLIRWLKSVGDKVEFDEPIMEIETDKITMEVESPATGVILAQYGKEDSMIPVLEVIGWIGKEGEVPPAAPAAGGAAAAPAAVEAAPATPVASAPVAAASVASGDVIATPYAKALAKEKGIDLGSVAPSGKHGEIKANDVLATPLAKRIADDQGVDLSAVAGSGHAGKVTKADVLASVPVPTAEGDVRIPVKGMRKVIAQRMLASHTQCPVVTQNMKVDVTKLLALRKQLNEGREQKISVNDFMIKIVARVVAESELARTQIDGDEFVVKAHANIGFAVGMDEGLLVPVIREANRYGLGEISSMAKDLAKRARAGALKPDELSGGTFTISNVGMYGIHSFTPIINQPESGILGVCAIEDELALVEGEIVVKKVMMLSLTWDHRIMDGTGAANLQLRMKELIENPMEALC